MTGPEHYGAAEYHVAAADQVADGTISTGYPAEHHLARAQIHATLALVAATIAHARQSGPEWSGVV